MDISILRGRVVQVFDNSKRKENAEDSTTVVIDEENEDVLSMLRVKLPGKLDVKKYAFYDLSGKFSGFVQNANTYLRGVPGKFVFKISSKQE